MQSYAPPGRFRPRPRHPKPPISLPVAVVLFEDAHWIDPTTLEVFGRLMDRIAQFRVLLIMTFRPDFDPPCVGQPHVTSLAINRLRRRDVDAMIDSVVGN